MVATASLSAGVLQHQYGWQIVNYCALPALGIILLSLIWLYRLTAKNVIDITDPDNQTLEDVINQAET